MYIDNFQVKHPSCVDRVTSIGNMQSNTTFNISIVKRFFYIACLVKTSYVDVFGCILPILVM